MEVPLEEGEDATQKAEGDEPAPVWANGSKNGLKPSHSEFDGELGKTEKGFPKTGRLIGPPPEYEPFYATAESLVSGGANGAWELITIE
jgi:hypothetical protein